MDTGTDPTHVLTNLGNFNNNANGVVRNRGSFTNNNQLSNATLATFNNEASLANNATGTIENKGSFITADGSSDSFINQGAFENNFPGEVTHGGFLLSTGSYVNGTGATTNNNRIFTSLSAGTIDNDGDFFISGPGTLNNDGILDNEGTLSSQGRINNAGALNNNGSLINLGIINNDNIINNQSLGTVNNDGTFTNTMMSSVLNNDNVFDGGDVQGDLIINFGTINNNETLSSDGTITNNGIFNNYATGTVSISEDLDNSSSGIITNDNKFSVGVGADFQDLTRNEGTFINNGDLSNAGRFINTGTIENNMGAEISTSNERLLNRGTLNNNGTVERNSGILRQDDANGVLSGAGTFELNGGELDINDGIIAPGNSFGTFTITGDYSVAGPVRHIIEIDGDGNSDQIIVTGSASINGDLELLIGAGEYSEPDDDWTILTAGTLSGSFSNLIYTFPPSVPGLPTLTDTYPSNTVLITYTGPTFLPVELIYFSGEVVGENIELNWSTSQELNNDYMAVERSADGQNFQEIGRVDGQGTTQQTQHYSLIDDQPLDGFNYYRLRQVDFDGTEYFSNVIVVNMEVEIEGIEVQLYPNPSSERIFVNWRSAFTSEGGWVRLIETASGKEIKRLALPEGTNQMEIPIEELPAGHYVIQLMQGGQQKAVQFVKN
jgi:hypothetical protein